MKNLKITSIFVMLGWLLPASAMAGSGASAIDKGDNAWMLFSIALVMLMIRGLQYSMQACQDEKMPLEPLCTVFFCSVLSAYSG